MQPWGGGDEEGRMSSGETWTTAVVTEPSVLVRNGGLFDRPVTLQGAGDFLRQGHVLVLATVPDGTGIGFVSGVVMRHPDKAPEMFVYELALAGMLLAASTTARPAVVSWGSAALRRTGAEWG